MPLQVYLNDHVAQLIKFDLSMMILNFLQFYQSFVCPIISICVLWFRCLKSFSNYHSHRMAMNRHVFDPFDSIDIDFGNGLIALHHDLLRSAINLMDL